MFILLGCTGYCYFKTDLFKTPDVLYKKYMAKSFNQIMNANYEPLGSALNRINNETFEDDLKIKINPEKLYDEDSLEYLSEEELEELKEGYIVDFILKSDPQNSKSELHVSMKSGEYESTLKTIISQEQIGMQLDELNENFLVIKNENLKNLFKKFGLSEKAIEEIPDKIIYDIDYNEKAEKINTLNEKYINRFFEQISEDKYKIEKKISIDYNGQSYTGNKYTLSITDKELSQILLTTIKELIEDPEFLNIIPEKDKEDFEKQIAELKENISDYEDKIEKLENKVIDLSVYKISDSFTVIEFKYDEGSIVLYAQSNENNSNIEVVIDSPNKDENTIFKISNQYTEGSGELTYSINIDSKETKVILKSTSNDNTVTTDISFEGEDFEEINKALTITNTIKFNDVKFNNVDDENSIIINDLSEDELEELVEEIRTNLLKTISGNSKSFIGKVLKSYYGSSLSSPYSSMYDDYSSFYNNSNDLLDNNSNTDTNEEDDNDDIIGLLENSQNDIEEERKKIEDEVEEVISDLLDEYHDDKRTNDEADPAEYLTEENIVSGCTYAKASIIDGNTIKSVKGDNVYYTKIYINGDDWTLTSVETTYSENGEIE